MSWKLNLDNETYVFVGAKNVKITKHCFKKDTKMAMRKCPWACCVKKLWKQVYLKIDVTVV